MRVDMSMAGAEELQAFFHGTEQQLDGKLSRAMIQIGTKWELEAKRRVPVDTGLLRNTIHHETGKDGGGHYVKVGSNQKYAKYVEFGTDRIAGGAVKALGTGEDVTDADAIRSWPAKLARLGGATLDSAGRLRVKSGKFAAGTATRTQMPWLRPSLNAIRDWIIDKLAGVFKFE